LLQRDLDHEAQALPESFWPVRMKALRFHLIGVAGKVVSHARMMFLKNHGRADWLSAGEKPVGGVFPAHNTAACSRREGKHNRETAIRGKALPLVR